MLKMKNVLPDEQRSELIETALEARGWAYAPYSSYRVGAALLASSGNMYDGVNVENAAYPTSICAERTAVFKAVSEGERQFVAIAVASGNGGMPCGACRQVLAEFGLDILVIVVDENGNIVAESTIKDLLPGSFGPEDLP
jgi:cytidine deaminase